VGIFGEAGLRNKVIQNTINLVKEHFNLHADIVVSVLKFKNTEDVAYCTPHEDFYELELSKKFVKNASEKKLVQVVAHEMVHVKQFENGELRYVGEKTFYKGDDCTSQSYWFAEWEREARGYEKAFWALYCERY